MIPNQPFQFSFNSCVDGYTNHDFTTDARGSVGMVAGEWYNFEIGQERVKISWNISHTVNKYLIST